MSYSTLRGSTLEEMLNLTNEAYRRKGLALVQKIPTPVTPVEFDAGRRVITCAYFEKKSTVDYIGAVQGVPICFDAKETAEKKLPLRNVQGHQFDFMRDFERQGGVAFLVVYFRAADEYYFVPFADVRRLASERKYAGPDEMDKRLLIPRKNGFIVHYLESLARFMEIIDSNGGAAP
ncbi:MAG: Holliday junction resolvase RecU [Clostridiales bacterium]|jgi:recombination protein U|nr:Holliday junction resolvase RecU [Clostridiales bacterium]